MKTLSYHDTLLVSAGEMSATLQGACIGGVVGFLMGDFAFGDVFVRPFGDLTLNLFSSLFFAAAYGYQGYFIDNQEDRS